MKLLAPDIENAISADTDLFGRDKFAAGLLNLFRTSSDSLVLALDEKWGTGKTVFARRLQRSAEAEGFRVAYFDAFAHDYEPDVFIALASTILAYVPNKSSQTDLKEKAKSVGKILSRVALKSAVRLATAGAVRASDFSEANSEIASELSDVFEVELDDLIDQRLSQSKQEEEIFSKFRETLSFLSSDGDSNESTLPLIFIVDELDRCRPDYALSIIETVKHFFSVPNVHFLLMCQIDQLSASIKARYGEGIETDIYLEKFIHARASFPVPDAYEYRNQIRNFVLQIMTLMPDDGEEGKLSAGMVDFLVETSIRKAYSLRRIERIITQFGLCMAYSNPRTLRLGAVVYVLCDLKHTNRILFQKAKLGALEYRDIKEFYGFDEQNHSWYVKWLRYFYDNSINREDKEWHSLASSLFTYSVGEPSDTARFFANDVVDRISV